MKSLRESLKTINEDTTVTIAFWSHWSPEVMNVVEIDKDTYNEFSGYDYQMFELDHKETKGLALVKWNDEDAWFESLEVSNENALKNKFKKSWNDILKKLNLTPGQILTEDDEAYWSLEDEHITFGEGTCHASLGLRDANDDKYEVLDGDKTYDNFKGYCNESYVDGDSAYAWAVVDMSRQETLFGNSVSFWDPNDWRNSYFEDEQ